MNSVHPAANELSNVVHDPDSVVDMNEVSAEDELRLLKDLGPYDVICGRDKLAFNNIGNRRFRVTISLHLRQYMAVTTRRAKSQMIKFIVQLVKKENGGRFLERRNNKWVDLNDKRCRMKVGHALRDMAGSAHTPPHFCSVPPLSTKTRVVSDAEATTTTTSSSSSSSDDMVNTAATAVLESVNSWSGYDGCELEVEVEEEDEGEDCVMMSVENMGDNKSYALDEGITQPKSEIKRPCGRRRVRDLHDNSECLSLSEPKRCRTSEMMLPSSKSTRWSEEGPDDLLAYLLDHDEDHPSDTTGHVHHERWLAMDSTILRRLFETGLESASELPFSLEQPLTWEEI